MPLIQLYNGFYLFWGVTGIEPGIGIYALGDITTTTNVYTYSGNTVVAGTALTTDFEYGAAAGNYNGGLS